MREIHEQTLVSDEHLQYAIFSSQPTIFEEAMNDAQWVYANEEVNKNDEVAIIDEQHQDVNALQEKMKYIHIFSDKFFEYASKIDSKKNYVETKEEEEDLHYVVEATKDSKEQLLNIKIQKTKKKKLRYTSMTKVKIHVILAQT